MISREKVIAFDSWTRGAAHIERLVAAFRERGLDLLFIHLGSWGHDIGREVEEYIGPLLVRDIAYYKGLSFKGILELEKPKAIVFLSTHALAHQAFNRYCQQLNIPTLHLYHGIVSVQPTHLKRLNPVNVKKQAHIVRLRLKKNVLRLWPLYVTSLWQTGAEWNEWLFFFRDMWNKCFNLYSDIAPPDSTTTACCVYTSADTLHAVKRYRMSLDAVFVVGNLDLIKFDVQEDQLGSALACQSFEDIKNIIYLETALLEAGAVFNDLEEYAQYLLETKEKLAEQGYRLFVKLHPASLRTLLPNRLSQLGLEICHHEIFMDLLMRSSAVITEPSSVALIPALYGVPLLLARYGKLVNQSYGTVLMSYPRARALYGLNEVTDLLNDIITQGYTKETQIWIKENTGPLPANHMPERVALVCSQLVKEKV